MDEVRIPVLPKNQNTDIIHICAVIVSVSFKKNSITRQLTLRYEMKSIANQFTPNKKVQQIQYKKTMCVRGRDTVKQTNMSNI